MIEQFKPEYTFDRIVEGSFNNMAVNAGRAISVNDAHSFNPFYIYAMPGLGKTHLLHAIGIETQKYFPNKKIKYRTSKDFFDDYTNAMIDKRIKYFDNLYKNIDLLMVDDFQFLTTGNKTATIEAFFNLFNNLYITGKQIIITSDVSPMKLNNLDERLVSRFSSGLITTITVPDYETRLAILGLKLKDQNIAPTESIKESIEYIASNITRNIRLLEGAFTQLVATTSILDMPINLENTKRIVLDYISKNESDITMLKILKSVSEYFNVPVSDILGPSREKEIIEARHFAMYLPKILLPGMSLPAVAREIGGKDHSTVIAARKKINKLLEMDDRKTNHDLQELVSIIKSTN
jgi:chromosomal replication initiator protein